MRAMAGCVIHCLQLLPAGEDRDVEVGCRLAADARQGTGHLRGALRVERRRVGEAADDRGHGRRVADEPQREGARGPHERHGVVERREQERHRPGVAEAPDGERRLLAHRGIREGEPAPEHGLVPPARVGGLEDRSEHLDEALVLGARRRRAQPGDRRGEDEAPQEALESEEAHARFR